MINWNEQDQVRDLLWGEHKVIEDHIVPQPKECYVNNFSKFGWCSNKHGHEDDFFAVSSAKETKNDFFSFNVKHSYGRNINEELNYSSVDMVAWPDLPNLSIALGGGFCDGIAPDSVVTGSVSEVDDASDMKSVGNFIEGFCHSSVLLHDKDSSPLSKASNLLSVNDMQLDGEPDLFGYDDNQNDKFLDYDWANIEDFGDIDKMFINNDSLFGNEMIDNADTFLTASADLISSTSQSIPVPDLLISGERTLEEGSYSYRLGESSIVEQKPLPKEKIDSPNQTIKIMKNDREKVRSSQGQKNLRVNKYPDVRSPPSVLNSTDVVQSQSIEQPSSSHHLLFADYGYRSHQFHALPLPPQSCTGKIPRKPVYSDFSNHENAAEGTSKPVTMSPREKIEKLRRRQQMQAMIAIQKQREQYHHQIPCSDLTKLSQKLPSSDASSLSEQDQSQMISSSLDGHSLEESIYYQLRDAMEKLDMNVKLSIRDSLYRLARSSMERHNISDENSANKCTNEEDEISAGEESNKDRYSRPPDSEAVTNHIDRIVAHLLFHNPSASALMPIADGDISMATSM